MQYYKRIRFLGSIRKILFIPSLLLISNYSILHCQTYTLQDCIRIALDRNIDIKIQKLALEQGKVQHRQTKNNLLPSLNLGSGVNYNIGYSINPLDYTFIEQNSFSGSANISSQVTLFQGFQQLKAIQKAELDYTAGSYQIRIIENQIKIQTINFYLQTFLEWESWSILKKQLNTNILILEKKKNALASGLIAKNALREQELQLTMDQANAYRQEFQYANAINRLKIFLQIPLGQFFQIDTFRPLKITERNENIHLFDLKSFHSLPELQLETIKLQSLEKQLEINKGALYPSITFGYALGSNFINTRSNFEYRTITNPAIGFVNDSQRTIVRSLSSQRVAISEAAVPVFSQLLDNRQHQFQLNLQWQIFGKGMKRTQIKLAEIATKQQEYRIKLTEQKLKDNYFQALSNAMAAYKRYEVNVTVSQAQKERYTMAKDRFENQLIDYFEFMIYQNQLFNSELELSKSKLEWYFNSEILKLYN
jgi:outer membrane protein